MLRKLLKYEFANCGRIILPLYAALIILTGLGFFLLTTDLMQNLPFIIQLGSILMYIAMILAVYFGTYILMIVRYYKHIYGDEGYLLNTLPVTASHKILSKLITSSVYALVSTVLCALSILAIVLTQFNFDEVVDFFEMLIEEFDYNVGIKFPLFCAILAIYLVINLVRGMMHFYASITLGQLFKKHKVIGGIIFYIAIYSATQALSSLTLVATNFNSVSMDDLAIDPGVFLIMIFAISSLISMIVFFACYLVSYVQLERNLNLE